MYNTKSEQQYAKSEMEKQVAPAPTVPSRDAAVAHHGGTVEEHFKNWDGESGKSTIWVSQRAQEARTVSVQIIYS